MKNFESEKIRVAFIIPSLKKGGAEKLLLTIASELKKHKDFDSIIIVLNDGNDYPELSEGLRIIRCHSKIKLSVLGKDSPDIDELFSILNGFKPHIIHSHLFEAEIVSRWKIIDNTIYFSHIHANEEQWKSFKLNTLLSKRSLTNYYERKFLLKKYRQCNNNFIAVSKHTENYLKEALPHRLIKKIFYIPNAIDLNLFYNKKSDSFKPEYKFLSVGRLDENKNHTFLLDVVKLLNHNGKPATLDIYGEGKMKEFLVKRIQALELSNSVRLMSNSFTICDILPNYSIYLHAAKKESFGLTILEAMAAGLPVVCLDGGGNRELIINGANGFIINKAKPELFVEKIESIINDTCLYQNMSKKANCFAKEFDISKYLNDLIDLYLKFIKFHK